MTLEITCPACAKRNLDLEACARCGCDLSMLRRIKAAAGTHLQAAKTALAECQWRLALDHAERSWNLLHQPLSAQLACLAASALRDPHALTRWQRRTAA